MDALVWAEDQRSAINAAKEKENLDLSKAWDGEVESVAKSVNPQPLLVKLPADPDRVLLVPEPQSPGQFKPRWRTVDNVSEFAAFHSDELAERLRLAAIENGNGQLSLLEAGGEAMP
jgi:hypothetical protein